MAHATTGQPLDRLDTAVRAMARAGQRRLLVATVETWSDVGDPTAGARVEQVRALLALGMTDRALARLQQLPADGPLAATWLELKIRIDLARGWVTRAKAGLSELMDRFPEHENLGALTRAIRARPPEIPDDPAALESLARADALALVRHQLATGGQFRALQLLDTFDRRWPGDPSLADLRWALEGDYRLQDTSLEDVLERWGGPTPRDEDLPTDEIGADHPALRNAPLPALFGHRPAAMDDATEEDMEDDAVETTQAMRLDDAFREHLAGELERTDASVAADAEDTQMLRVIRHDETTDDVHGTSPDLERPDLEAEDDEVVVMRRDAAAVPPVETRMPLPEPPMPVRRRRPKPPPADEPLPDLTDAIQPVGERSESSLVLAAALAGGAFLALAGAMLLLFAASQA